MKITVNKDAKQQRIEKVVQEIIAIAKETAERGIGYFNFPTDHLNGICRFTLGDLVEEATEDSVYIGCKGLKQGYIKFSIRED